MGMLIKGKVLDQTKPELVEPFNTPIRRLATVNYNSKCNSLQTEENFNIGQSREFDHHKLVFPSATQEDLEGIAAATTSQEEEVQVTEL